jgi:predicted secreted Zn-dependent protease
MGVFEGRGVLAKATKDLFQRWQEVKLYWDDANAKAFEERFLRLLEQDIRNAATAMDHVAGVINRAKTECS